MSKRISHSICPVIWANFDSWIRSPRTVLLFVFLSAICLIEVRHYGRIPSYLEYGLHWDELCAYCSYSGCDIKYTSIILLIMMSEVPRKLSYQYQHLMRLGRTKWINAQILYCILSVIAVQVFILLFVSLGLSSFGIHETGWSTESVIADGIATEDDILIPLWIQEKFSPLETTLICQIPIFLFWSEMILIVLLTGLIFSSSIGIILYTFIIMSNIIIMVEAFDPRLFVMNYVTVATIAKSVPYGVPPFDYLLSIILKYAIIILVTIIVIHHVVKKKDINYSSMKKE